MGIALSRWRGQQIVSVLQLRKDPARSIDSLIDIVFAVRDGHKACFKRGWCQVDAFFQHQMEEALEAFNVTLHHILIAGHGFRIGEENPEHPTNVVYHQRNTGFLRGLQQAVTS